MAQLVTVDPNSTQCLQVPSDGALPTAAASCQANYIWKEREMGRVLEQNRQDKIKTSLYNYILKSI